MALGWVNIALWVVALFPQLVTNYRTKRADVSCVVFDRRRYAGNGLVVQSLSGLFLAAWLVGDISNLLGCILTNQLPTVRCFVFFVVGSQPRSQQLYTAVYFCLLDVAILSQWFYYSLVRFY